jgi:hypothetical protein
MMKHKRSKQKISRNFICGFPFVTTCLCGTVSVLVVEFIGSAEKGFLAWIAEPGRESRVKRSPSLPTRLAGCEIGQSCRRGGCSHGLCGGPRCGSQRRCRRRRVDLPFQGRHTCQSGKRFEAACPPVAKELGIATGGWHDFRHSLTTNMRRSAVHPKVISGILGHSAVTLAMNTYDHLEAEDFRLPPQHVSGELLLNVTKSAKRPKSSSPSD